MKGNTVDNPTAETGVAIGLIAVASVDIVKQSFGGNGGIEALLERIKAETANFVPDVSTAKGREAIASLAHKVARSKTFIDEAGKELVEADKKRIKRIDDERKKARDTLDQLKAEVRKPLTDWETAEQARVDGIKARIEEMRVLAIVEQGAKATDLKDNLAELKSFAIDESFAEFIADAAPVKDAGIATLEKAIAAAEKYEAEQAELARLRAAEAARAAEEAEAKKVAEIAEKAAAAARQAAQAELDAANNARIAAEQAAKAALFDKQEAERKAAEAAQKAESDRLAAIEAERQAQAAVALQKQQETAARSADELHRDRIHGEIAAALSQYIKVPRNVGLVLGLIVDGKLPHVKVEY